MKITSDNTEYKIPVFRFDEKEHLYFLGDAPMTGVTTILQCIAKPQLIQWAANEAIKYIEEHAPHPIGKDYQVSTILLQEAKTAHRRKKEEAGTKGTDIHSEIETLIKYAIKNNKGIVKLENSENPMIDKFLKWSKENKAKFLESEKRVYSKELFYAGTADFMAEIAGKRYIGDIKTSSTIYPEAFYQMAAYRKAYEEMGENPLDGAVVVNITKKGELNVEYSYFYQEDFDAFLGALKIYRRQNKPQS